MYRIASLSCRLHVQLVAVAALEANKLQNLKVHLTKFMEFPCGEDINFSPDKEIIRIWWNQNYHPIVHWNPPFFHIPTRKSPFLSPYCTPWRSVLIFSFDLRSRHLIYSFPLLDSTALYAVSFHSHYCSYLSSRGLPIYSIKLTLVRKVHYEYPWIMKF